MAFRFEWNPFADQPHNVAPRKERLRHHIRHGGTYFSLLAANLCQMRPVLALYRRYWRRMYQQEVKLGDPFGVSVSPEEGREEEILTLLREMNAQKALLRIPSWERENLDFYERFAKGLFSHGVKLTAALLQNREDVTDPQRWTSFLEEVFSRFNQVVDFFEIGHAWNRTKWGVWDYQEYLSLARPASVMAEKYQTKTVGPAVIDFEFHLYPPVLEKVSFDRISSLLYVDRMGAPENKQYGWNTSRKLALLKAIVDVVTHTNQRIWITEVNWPLKGTGKYSPASGKPNVSEEEQADFLVRYYILCLASGFVERIYWWQLVAPGYGLVDSRERPWRKRPSYQALKTLIVLLQERTFSGRVPHPEAELFSFTTGEKDLVVCWTTGPTLQHRFSREISRVLSRNGQELTKHENSVQIDGSPKYVVFK